MQEQEIWLDGTLFVATVGMMAYDGTYMANWGRIYGKTAETEQEALANLEVAIRQVVDVIRQTDLINRINPPAGA